MFSEVLVEKFEKLETPFYYYDLELLSSTLSALKANSNNKILKIICDAGFGADCVSGNEVSKAIAVGFKNDQIVFAGVGKSDSEIKTALKENISLLASGKIGNFTPTR